MYREPMAIYIYIYIYIYVCVSVSDHAYMNICLFFLFFLFYQFYLCFDLIAQSRVRIYIGKCYFILHVYTFLLDDELHLMPCHGLPT